MNKKYKVSLIDACGEKDSLSFRSEDGKYKNKYGEKIHVVTKAEPAITIHYPYNVSKDYRFVIEDLVKEKKGVI